MTKLEEIAAEIARIVMDAECNATIPNFVDRVIARHESATAIARAVLSTLKTPTPGMVEAGQAACEWVKGDEAADIYRAMIDAADDGGKP